MSSGPETLSYNVARLAEIVEALQADREALWTRLAARDSEVEDLAKSVMELRREVTAKLGLSRE